MTESSIRLRRHTDGSVALNLVSALWLVTIPNQWSTCWVTDEDVFGAGWSELFVADLPEPDYTVQWIACWDLHAGGEMTVDTGTGELETPHLHTGEQARSDALKMLAAVAACEKYRAEREATT
jgi:hypothetical protein